jgi:hypothetical protein
VITTTLGNSITAPFDSAPRRPLQLQAHPRSGQVGAQGPALGIQHAVEQEALDAGVVGEVLEVAEVGDGHGRVGRQGLGAMGGNLEVVGGGEGGDAQPFGDPRAARDVRLEAVHRTGLEHAPEVGQVVAVLAGGDVGGALVADLAQARQVIGGDRLLEPGDAHARELPSEPDRLLAAVGAVGVDVQLDLVAQRPAHARDPLQVAPGEGAPGAADLELHPRDPVASGPAAELLDQLVVGERGEPAAAVDRDLVAEHPEQAGERLVEQARLEVPHGGVDRRDRHRADPGTAEVADRAHHATPGAGDVERVGVQHHLGEHVADQGGAGAGRVGEAEPGPAPGDRLDDHHGGLGPGEGAVGLRLLGGDRVHGDVEPLDRRRAHPAATCSAQRAASAMIVSAGLALPWVGRTLPSQT